jgi:hypothetical protein
MKMKNTYLLVLAMAVLSFSACKKGNFLDSKGTDVIDREKTFADSANTMDFLSGLYLDNTFNFQIGSAHVVLDYSKMSDEAEGRYPALGNYDKVVTQGTFATPFFNQATAQWTLFYKNIHNANIFLEDVDKSPLSAAKKVRTKAEARFLRAFYYSFLIKYFGGVPLVGDKVFSTTDQAELIRSTYEECVNYTVSELDAIANDLPLSYTGLDYGRITRGAALALKARVLLFAASPLSNGGSTATDPQLIPITAYPTYDQNRWEKARLAAKAVMDLGVHQLNVNNSNPAKPGNGFYELFISRVNSEFIFARPLPTGKQMEQGNNPKSRGGTGFYTYPTQEFVDKFPTINGKPIAADLKSPSNPLGYDATNPYANRDPRFQATVIYNTSLYFLNSAKALREVYTYVGAESDGIVAITANTATITGYYTRKFCDELASVGGGNNVDRSIPIIRYAEVLLSFAEASNEMGNTADAINTLKQLRIRAGINAGSDNLYGLPANPSKEELRTVIQNERDIELAFEQHRFWDIRRWKIGGQIDGKVLHGMRITRIGTTGSNYTYQRIDVRSHYFKEIYYYFPIPREDVTLNPAMLQNPGY